MFEASVSVNAENNGSDRLRVTCDNSTVPADTLAKYSPRVRILEVSAGGVYSGVVLQIGMKLGAGILQETFDIEDMSGRESCWKLIPFSATSTPPEDTGVLMPNGVSTFSIGEPTAVVNTSVIPFKEGLNFLLTEANIPVEIGSIPDGTVGSTVSFDDIIPALDEVVIKNAKAFSVTMTINIGNIDEHDVEFIVPIMSKDAVNKRYSGQCSVDHTSGHYELTVALWYDTIASRYTVGYYMSSVTQGTTWNVVSTKLTF